MNQRSTPRTHEERITNLPIPVSSLIGRKREMAEVKELTAKMRLVTVTGAGGSGKTRLAIQVAGDMIDSLKGGVWWVKFALLMDAALVPQEVRKALGVREVPHEALIASLVDYLRVKQLLLVLDNCEHVVNAWAFQVHFNRRESRSASERYVTGLLLEHPTKNCETLAAAGVWMGTGNLNSAG